MPEIQALNNPKIQNIHDILKFGSETSFLKCDLFLNPAGMKQRFKDKSYRITYLSTLQINKNKQQ